MGASAAWGPFDGFKPMRGGRRVVQHMVLEVSSISGMRFGSLFFAALAVLLGVLASALVRRAGGARGTALTGGMLLAVATFGFAYSTSLSGFCRVDLRGDALQLEYAFPWLDRDLVSKQIVSVESQPGNRPFLAKIRLKLGDGSVFESASSNRSRIELVELELRRFHRKFKMVSPSG